MLIDKRLEKFLVIVNINCYIVETKSKCNGQQMDEWTRDIDVYRYNFSPISNNINRSEYV